jgi:type I restriction enzyme M protein
VRQGFIKGIIGLPANLFYGTGIPACIIVLDKEGAAGRTMAGGGIFMVDASKGFIKDGNKNRLRAQDMHRMVDTFTRQDGSNPKYARLVPLSEIAANDYNLNLPRYIDSTEPEDLQDIEAHLKGGIPLVDIDGLHRYWQVLPAVRQALFTPVADAKRSSAYCHLTVEPSQIKTTIFGHSEFTTFNQTVTQRFATWKAAHTPLLTGIQLGDRPKALIEKLSESLLQAFEAAPLIDAYDVYQHLMDYWAETLQDDVWMIATDGWQAVQDGKPNVDLIPTALVVARYFAAEQQAVDALEAERDAVSRQMEEQDEELGGEGGLLEEGKTDKGKLTTKSVKDRLKSLQALTVRTEIAEAQDEIKALKAYAALLEQEATASKKAKDAQKALDAKVAAKYAHLTLTDIQTLVVQDKWLATLSISVQSELDRVSQALTGRIRQLAERYATPLPTLTNEIEVLTSKVGQHLKTMGFQLS